MLQLLGYTLAFDQRTDVEMKARHWPLDRLTSVGHRKYSSFKETPFTLDRSPNEKRPRYSSTRTMNLSSSVYARAAPISRLFNVFDGRRRRHTSRKRYFVVRRIHVSLTVSANLADWNRRNKRVETSNRRPTRSQVTELRRQGRVG